MSTLAVVTGTHAGLGKAVHEALLARDIACISIAREAVTGTNSSRHISADLAQLHNWDAHLRPKLSQFEFSALVFFDIAAVLPREQRGQTGFDVAMEEAMRVNVTTPLAIASALYDAAGERGATLNIVHVSSGAALRPIPGWEIYCATKKVAANSWREFARAHEGVTARIFQPGVIATEMQAELRARCDPSAAPEGSLRSPEDVAAQMLRESGIAT